MQYSKSKAPPSIAELVDLLTSAQRALTRELGSALDEDSVNVDQWRVLRALAHVDQGRAMGELATLLEIAHPTLTRLVDALVDTSHLYRTQSAEDRRRVSVHLSSRGERLLERLDAIAAAHENSVRHRCGTDTIDRLITALYVVRAKLDAQPR